jgi:hypothetical protein
MSLFFKEARLTLALAVPIIVGQVSQMLMGVTDSIMIGRLGAVPLAASAFAGGMFSVFFVVGIGLLLPVAVFVSREHGAGNDRAGARWLQHGVALAVVASIVEMLAMAGLAAGFDRMGQPPEVLAEIEPYYTLIVVSLLPVLVFQVFRQFAEALGRPWMPMFILLASVALNVLLNWILIYGKLGAPALGLAGAGWATLASRIAALAGIILWLRRAEAFRRVFPDTWVAGLQLARIREMLRLGVPAAVMLFFRGRGLHGRRSDDGLARCDGVGGAPDRAELRGVYVHVSARAFHGGGHAHRQSGGRRPPGIAAAHRGRRAGDVVRDHELVGGGFLGGRRRTGARLRQRRGRRGAGGATAGRGGDFPVV